MMRELLDDLAHTALTTKEDERRRTLPERLLGTPDTGAEARADLSACWRRAKTFRGPSRRMERLFGKSPEDPRPCEQTDLPKLSGVLVHSQ